MYFAKLDSRDVDPELFVNRSDEVEGLEKGIAGYLDVTDARLGRAFRVTGGKGSGKTIFARHALRRLKARYGGDTLFLDVDCRRCPDSRAVFYVIAQRIIDELFSLKRATVPIKDELTATAQVLGTITHFTSVELKVAHEHVTQYKAAAELSGQASFYSTLKTAFNISVERSKKQYEGLSGSVQFDEYRLCLLLRDFFSDLREQGLKVVLFVDNLDELHHNYRDPAQREHARQQAEWVLELKQAPIALLACMRTYFSEIARDIGNKLTLRPLPANAELGILERRMKDEPAGVREEWLRPEVKNLADKLAHLAPTPLAYLDWFKTLCEQNAFDTPRRSKAIEHYVRAEYASTPFEVIARVARAFPSPEHELDRAALLEACGDSEPDLAAIQDHQVVLPNDFWNPTRFTLDPSLHLLHAGAW
jgi:AAA ATPase domain